MTKRSKRVVERGVKFCPMCGSNNIWEDTFNPAAINRLGQQRHHGVKFWICNSCFSGFCVRPSPRQEYVRFMIREDTRGYDRG